MNQPSIFGDDVLPPEQDGHGVRQVLDELFVSAGRYRASREYRELLEFIARFRFYSAFNAMLAHVQMPGATYVATARRWRREFRRLVKAGARPLVILQPMGPVMFVFDVSDTEPMPGAPPLPPEVENPFAVRHGEVRRELQMTTENAKRDGILVVARAAGSQSAGEIRPAEPGRSILASSGERSTGRRVRVPLRYEVMLNSSHGAEAKYATLVHELGHLYCGHLGTPDVKWWPGRAGLTHTVQEFEAESVCYLVCTRLGIDNPSDAYLAGYVRDHEQTPPISLDCTMRAVQLIEVMGSKRLKLRKGMG
jgi:hypothetical protein